MKKVFLFAASAAALLTLAACGGGGDSSSTQVAASDLKVSASPTTTEAMANQVFTFESGIAALGTDGTATDLTFTNGTSFSASAGGKTATGTTGYGSCIFTVKTTTFAPSHPLGQVDTPHRIDPCEIEIQSRGVAATGVPASANARLVLANLASRNITAAIRVLPDGQLMVGQALFGTVPTAPPTGATGGSGL